MHAAANCCCKSKAAAEVKSCRRKHTKVIMRCCFVRTLFLFFSSDFLYFSSPNYFFSNLNLLFSANLNLLFSATLPCFSTTLACFSATLACFLATLTCSSATHKCSSGGTKKPPYKHYTLLQFCDPHVYSADYTRSSSYNGKRVYTYAKTCRLVFVVFWCSYTSWLAIVASLHCEDDAGFIDYTKPGAVSML